MMQTPAQHQADPDKAPGQSENPVGTTDGKPIKTLDDYIKKVEVLEKPPTEFDKWWLNWKDRGFFYKPTIQMIWQEASQHGYLEGYDDGVHEGFTQGVAWMSGK